MNSPLESIPIWVGVPVALLLVVGASIVLIGAIGLLRLPLFYQRIHGPAITITLGTGCVLIASMLYFSTEGSRLAIHELLITAFVFLTAPVVAMLVMRAAVYRDIREGRLPSFADATEVDDPIEPAREAGNEGMR